jgi:hypothetical protein
MIEAIVAVVLGIIAMCGVIALSIWVLKVCYPCHHSYERIDTYDDKKMILVCRRCGKIKKLRK